MYVCLYACTYMYVCPYNCKHTFYLYGTLTQTSDIIISRKIPQKVNLISLINTKRKTKKTDDDRERETKCARELERETERIEKVICLFIQITFNKYLNYNIPVALATARKRDRDRYNENSTRGRGEERGS